MLLLALALGGCGSSPAPGTMPGNDGGATADVGPPPNIDDPIEPVWRFDEALARVKSPGQRMQFTAGLPFRILADASDPRAHECPPGRPPYVCPDSSMVFYVDGKVVGTVKPDPENQNLWELRVPEGLATGDHVITVRFTPHGGSAVDGLVPIYVHVAPVPSRPNTINLTSNVVLTGSTDLNWTDAVVNGNGHTVTAAAGYSGKVVIRNSLVTGLAGFGGIGIHVTTTGAVDVSGSVFEATAPLRLIVNGSAPISIKGNEFRSTNYLTYVASDPTRPLILELSGSTSGAKVMQGNNIGAGIVRITGMPGWQIGGLRDSQSNIFVGPRCVLELESSPDAVVQGNYLHHDYYGGWSQGFNFMMSGGSAVALAEHNVIRDGSWPVQSFGGELRYNLLINSGHNFLRSSQSGTRIHHNILAHAQGPNSGYDGGMFLYSGEQNIAFDSNTVDMGGEVGWFDAPAIVLAMPSVSLSSMRNNVFTQFVDANGGWANKAFVTGAGNEASVGAPRITRADYNAWHNPLAPNTRHYMPGIVAGTPGNHDVKADPTFAGPVPQAPFQVDEGLVWLRRYGVSQVLGYYRALYTPRVGSPLIDAGDPADGAGNDIGAVGAGTAHAADKFGLVMDPS